MTGCLGFWNSLKCAKLSLDQHCLFTSWIVRGRIRVHASGPLMAHAREFLLELDNVIVLELDRAIDLVCEREIAPSL